jgi:hypothetical protein
MLNIYFSRWNHGPIHRNESPEFGGTHILDVEMSSKFLSQENCEQCINCTKVLKFDLDLT